MSLMDLMLLNLGEYYNYDSSPFVLLFYKFPPITNHEFWNEIWSNYNNGFIFCVSLKSICKIYAKIMWDSRISKGLILITDSCKIARARMHGFRNT